MAGEIRKLDTSIMTKSVDIFKENILGFEQCRNNIDKITTELLSTWTGKSRSAYEMQYNLLTRSLKDIEDDLYDFYNALIDSGGTYIEADEKIAREISK